MKAKEAANLEGLIDLTSVWIRPADLVERLAQGEPPALIEVRSTSVGRQVGTLVVAVLNCEAPTDGAPCWRCGPCRAAMPNGGVFVIALDRTASPAYIRGAVKYLRRRPGDWWE